jgi:hypothetical protein
MSDSTINDEEENNTEKESLEYEDIKDYLGAIENSLGQFYGDVKTMDLLEFMAVAKSYGVYDNMYNMYGAMQDKDVSGAIGFELSKMSGAAGGAWLAMKIVVLSPNPLTKNPAVVIAAGIAGAYWGEKGVEQFENTIREYVNDFLGDVLGKYEALSQEDRITQAQMIAAGGMPWDYNVNSVRQTDQLVLDLNHDGIINTNSLSDSDIFFDLDDNGISERAA